MKGQNNIYLKRHKKKVERQNKNTREVALTNK